MPFGFTFGEQSTAFFITIRGTVIRRIFWTVLAFLIYSCVVVGIHFYVVKLGIFNNLVGVLGIIISLLLGFRAKDALARYNEGRMAFATIKKTVRLMAQTLWIHVPVYTTQDLIEKKTTTNLLDGFCYALKHYLREEYSYEEEDLRSRTAFLPKFAGRSAKLDEIKVLTKFDRQTACEFKPPTNIPQEILYCLTIYSQYVRSKHINMYKPRWVFLFDQGINSLESTLSQLESMQRTPMPLCYASHLEHAFWIYLLALPFQLLGTFGWFTVPIVGFAIFFFVGVMSISLELEDPFGYDANDLPLDDYCYTIRKELSQITAIDMVYEDIDSWVLTSENQPFYPYSDINAETLADKSMETAIQILQDVQAKALESIKSRNNWKSPSRDDEKRVEKIPGVENPVGCQIGDENV